MKLIFAISIVALSFFGTACRRSVGEMILVPMPQEATFTGGYFETDSARFVERAGDGYVACRIDPRNGPAMSYSVFAIQYARLGMAEKACEMFRRSYLPNLRPPFGVFAETATSGNPYFMTGAGGMLQAVLFGFGGLEITADGLVQRPSVLPPQWKNLRIKINGKIYQATNQ